MPGQSVAREWPAVSEFEPKAGHRILDAWYPDGQELEIGSGRRIYLYSRDKYRRLDRTHNLSWSA